MGIIKKTLRTISLIITFLFRGAIPLCLTFNALQSNDEEQIFAKLNQWATLALIMFLEPYLSPIFDIIPGGSIIFTLIYFWIFSPYFSLSDLTYNYIYSPILGQETSTKYYQKHLSNIKQKYKTILSDLDKIESNNPENEQKQNTQINQQRTNDEKATNNNNQNNEHFTSIENERNNEIDKDGENFIYLADNDI